MGARGSKNKREAEPLLQHDGAAGEAPLPDQELVTTLMKASFHSYEEGHEKPYITYLKSPLRQTPLNVEFSEGQEVSYSSQKQGSDAGDEEEDVRLKNRPPKGWEVVAFVNCTVTDTQMWLYCREKPSKQIIVAFRGTSVKHGFSKDMWTDLNFKRKVWADMHDEEGGEGGSAAGSSANQAKGGRKPRIQVHTGFHEAYSRSVGSNHLLLRLIDDLIAEKEAAAAGKPAAAGAPITVTATAASTGAGAEGAAPGRHDHGSAHAALEARRGTGAGWHVLLTGHSLGGALATLAAYELAKEKKDHGRLFDISLYTYGAPRVGNQAFAEDFDARVTDAWRMVNPKDVVPRVPPVSARYCHCGTHCRVKQGRVEVMPREKEVSWFRRVLRNTAMLVHSLLGSWIIFRITKWHGIYKEYLADPKDYAIRRLA
ncbi:hypothetical protein GPECTOR_19g226 [Gonium pectorale]|uniref:Fungal lipase-type domain-containing protein n=1 Tax=Gonium pectorale TaxID=33097 RepID=A0A150GJ95_GONPE|nr:hypothetical protein GPECTOR_19g226 [Gonium pectorale]|eukprot:KXZ49775.1 hypothetical protein GPECTOR_19g226 [Gonium pectorale]